MALYGLESPRESRRVLFTEQVVDGLRMRAIEGYVALPRRGIEVGGILFGETRSGEIRIEGFEEVPCEHRYGPSYALSENDRVRLGELLAQRRGGPRPVAGFFRSFTARDPVIEEADEGFVRERFSQGDFLFLMLQPQSPETCLASPRFFRDGQLLPEPEDPPGTFDIRQMRTVESQPVQLPPSRRAREAAAERAAAMGPQLVKPKLVEAKQEDARTAATGSPRKEPRWWLRAAVCAVLLLGGALVYELWSIAQLPRWVELHLDARPSEGKLAVSWDANALKAVDATRGLLAVTDGEAHQDIALSPAQLRTGEYLYTPSHDEVSLRLILYANGFGVSGDAVRVTPVRIQAAAPGPKPQAEPERPAPPPPPAPAPSAADTAVAAPPSPLHEVQPRIPAGIRSRITERIVIPVEVEVDAHGRVLNAAAETKEEDGVHRYLAEQARKAARSWQFKPAHTRTGAPAAAKTTIQFVFTR